MRKLIQKSLLVMLIGCGGVFAADQSSLTTLDILQQDLEKSAKVNPSGLHDSKLLELAIRYKRR